MNSQACRYVLFYDLLHKVKPTYRTRAIITRGLYTFYPIFEGPKRFLRSFFRKILTLCMVSIQERFQIKSRNYGGARTVMETNRRKIADWNTTSYT